MKYKTIDDIGKKYRSLKGINTSWKIPVFENVEEFKAYKYGKEIDLEKATQKLFEMAEEEDKFQYGEDGVWNRCRAVIKRQLAAELEATKEQMMLYAEPSQYDVVGVSEEHTIGRFDETAEFFVGLFVNEKVAKECVDTLVERKISSPDRFQYLNIEGEFLNMKGEPEYER